MLKELLERKGYEVATADNGAKGVSMYMEDPADLIITDMIMPVKSGAHVILDIKKHYPKVKIIAISGYWDRTVEEYLEVAEILNARYTFKKPFSLEELLRAVKELIGNT